MLKKIRRFFRDYRMFGFVVLVTLGAIILDLVGWDTISKWVLIITSVIAIVPLIIGMWRDVQSGKYGIDILAATAIIASLILKEYYAAIIIVFMLTGGEALEDYAENRAKVELDALLKRAPKKARLLRGQKETEVPVKEIRVGDKLVIRPGEVIPVDGQIMEGRTSLDESSITGESVPINKNEGDIILSGALNIDGALVIRAIATAEDSQYQQIIKLVKNAASTESPFVRLADRYAVPFTVLSFALAISVWVLSGDPMRFLQVIVVATPCPLLLAAPIALISGMSRAAKHGIIVKTGSALERLAESRTIAFDKTGTLTYGKPQIKSIQAFAPFKKEEVLSFAAALEQGSNHVLAEAILNQANRDNLRLAKPKQLQETSGNGLSAVASGRDVLVGRLDFLIEESVELPARFNAKSIKTTATFVAINGKLAGVITFSDHIRENSKSMLARLRVLGIRHTLMITGDNEVTATAVANKLGITEVVAGALPGGKIRAIESVVHRPVTFVGDGVNDAPVLTASDVGIALGARGSTAASESADIVVMTDDISQVSKSVEIAKKTFSIARQAILIGIGMSFVLQLIFATGRFSPALGAVLQEIVDVTVIFIALRAHGSFKQPASKVKLQQA